MSLGKLTITLLIGVPAALVAIALVGAAIDRASQPTEDQLYGCTVAMAAPNGECQ